MTIRRRLRVASLLACCVVGAHAVAAGGQVTNDPLAEREALRERQAEVASELDVLRSSDQEITDALGAINAELSAQIDKVAEAQRSTAAALTAEAEAAAEVTAAETRVAEVTDRLRAMAVELFVRPPNEDIAVAIVRATPNEAPVSFALARFRLEDTAAVLRELKQRQEELSRAQRVAYQTRIEAEQTQRAEEARLVDLEAARARQQAFADQVAERIERALGEVAVLDVQDQALAAEIQRRQVALAATLAASPAVPAITPVAGPGNLAGGVGFVGAPATPSTDPPVVAPPIVTPPPIAPGVGNPGAGTTTPPTVPATAPPPTAPPTTRPPTTTTAPPRTVTVTPVDTTWVWGIEVATSIAGPFGSMMDAAAAAGISLSGSGYRDINDQIAIRREVCGPTDYDIWDRPSWECSPPVARPGYSMHEKGLAIDFIANGDLIRSQSNPGFVWLSANAARFGFYNLPSEPWHWSVNGR